MDEEHRRAVRTDSCRAEDPCALALEPGTCLLNVLRFKADVVLSTRRVFLEEVHDRRSLAERLDQFDLAVGRVHEADADALRGKVERFAMRLDAEHGPV